MAQIPITGLPSSYRVPGGYAEIIFAQGPATAEAGVRHIIFAMPITAAGNWTVNTVNRVRSEDDAIDGGGVGSPTHRAFREALKANKNAKYYALPYPVTNGGVPVAATGTVTWATDPTATGNTSVEVCGEEVSYGYDSDDTVTTIATQMTANVNAKVHLPVTASVAAGVMTMTAKVVGTSQGDGTTGAIRFRSKIDTGTGTTVADSGAALGLGTGTVGAEGSTTEAANLATALAIIADSHYYYIGVSIWDSTGLANLKTHVSTKSEPLSGLRSRGYFAFTGALAACQTLATTLNFERQHCIWQPNSELDPASLVGNVSGVVQKREEVDAAYNFDFYRAADWSVPRVYDDADFISGDDLSDAINDGITPIQSDQNGSYIVYHATTRSKNSAGTLDDPRVLEAHRVSVADKFVDDALVFYGLNFIAKKLKKDGRLPDNSVNTNQRVGNDTVTPHNFKTWIQKQLDAFEEAELLQDAVGSKAGLNVVVDPNNAGRLEVGCGLIAIDLLHQTTFRFAEKSSG